MTSIRSLRNLSTLSACLLACSAASADFRELAGWNRLIERIGIENVLDGDGMIIGMVEASYEGSYGLNPGDGNFTSHTIIDQGLAARGSPLMPTMSPAATSAHSRA